VPIAIKDEMDVRGYPTTIGTSFHGARTGPTTRDATVVARLRAAGAIIVGKANMHEIGIGVTGLNPHHGPARNPYDPAHHAGGSSGGSAAAVAAGLVPVAIGADGGGSIRIPAAFCGMVGLKSTFGRVSGHGAAPLCWSVGYLGPIAANAEDAALVYRTIAGPDPLDPNTAQQPPVAVDPARMYGLDGVRIGVYRPWFEHATGEVVGHCDRMLRILRERGAVATEIELPGLEPMRVAHLVTILSEMAAGLADVYDRHHGDFGPDARITLAVARTISSREYVHAQRLRTRAMATFAAAFEAVDLIATPSTAIPAPAIPREFMPGGGSDASQAIEMMRYAFPGNLTGHPAISIPAGYTASGLPVGLQLTGRPWGERLLLRAATIAGLILERERPRRWYAILDEA